MVSPSRVADVGVFGIPVNGFHPQLTAVSNPVQPNDIPPPSWPLCVPTVTSRRVVEERKNRRRGSPGSTTSPSAASTNDAASAAPITSEIDARMAIVVRRLQNDAKETDRSRSKMLRKRVRREERNERRHMRKRLRRQQQGNQQGRRTSEATEVSFSSMSSSFSTSTGTDATTTTTTTSSASSVATTSYDTTRASHVGSSSSTAQGATPSAMAPPTTTLPSERYGAQPITRVEAAPIPSVDDETHFSELYSDVFMTSNRPQFLATLGGRLVAWNEEFLAATGIAKAQLSGCMTVHNLVDSKYHAVLNDLFELALRGDADTTKSQFVSNSGSVSSSKAIQTATTAATAAVVVASGETTAMSSNDSNERRIAAAMAPPSSVCLDRSISPRSDLSDEEEDDLPRSSSAQYTSLMLPCALSPLRGMGRRQVTIVLMNDVDPSRRCLYCILSPMESSHMCSVDGLLPSLLVEHSKGITCTGFSDGNSRSPILPNSCVTDVGAIRKIGDDELANLL